MELIRLTLLLGSIVVILFMANARLAFIARLPMIKELNIGHAIIADSIFMGIEASVKEYKRLMIESRR